MPASTHRLKKNSAHMAVSKHTRVNLGIHCDTVSFLGQVSMHLPGYHTTYLLLDPMVPNLWLMGTMLCARPYDTACSQWKQKVKIEVVRESKA